MSGTSNSSPGDREREQRAGDCRKPVRIERGSRGTRLELGQRFGQSPMGGGALKAVAVGYRGPGLAAFELRDAVEQDCRCSLDRHVDQPPAPFLAAAAFDELG